MFYLIQEPSPKSIDTLKAKKIFDLSNKEKERPIISVDNFGRTKLYISIHLF